MEYIIAILTGLGLSACLGFKAFLPPFILGLVYKFFPDAIHINESFKFLAQDYVLLTLCIATVIEFAGDKIPWVDHLLDQLALPAKFLLSIVLTFALIPGASHWFYLLIAVVFSAGTTLTVHTAKTGLRASSTAVTGGVANPAIGILEDIMTVAGSLVAIFIPLLAFGLLIFILYRSYNFLFGKKGGNDNPIAKTKPSVFIFFVSLYITRFFFKIYNRLEINGVENIPEKKPFIVIGNHASILDGWILIQGIKYPLYIMVKKEAFENPISGWYLRKVLTYPVDRSKPDRNAIKWALEVLSRSDCLGIFPEGTRNRDGKVGSFKHGAIKFAIKRKIPIVPAYISNSHKISPDGCFFPKPVKLSISYLPIYDIEQALKKGKTEEDILQELQNSICAKGSEIMGHNVKNDIPETSDNNSEKSIL